MGSQQKTFLNKYSKCMSKPNLFSLIELTEEGQSSQYIIQQIKQLVWLQTKTTKYWTHMQKNRYTLFITCKIYFFRMKNL